MQKSTNRLVSAIYDEWYPFAHLFTEHASVTQPDALRQGDVLLLWGGQDISPMLYNHKKAPQTGAPDDTLPFRDQIEADLARRAVELGLPIIGICRGAQLMCALAGGTLIQHVQMHAGSVHGIMTDQGQRLQANSAHHQMMNPFKVDHHLLAWTDFPRSKVYLGEYGKPDPEFTMRNIEPEIVWFPKVKALGIQGHPEWRDDGDPFQAHCIKLVEQYCLK